MLRKTKIGLLLALAVTLFMLTACEKAQAELTPAVLEGQSEHWKATLDYKVNGSTLEETTIVTTTITQEEMEEVTVIIQHKNQQPLSYPVLAPLAFKTGRPYTLSEKAQVNSWKDTEQVAIEWKIGSTRLKEYITPKPKQ
jgi:hypothetical protein